MKRQYSSEHNTSQAITHECVTRESSGGLPRKHTRAFEALQNRCVELFAAGKNTMEIASQVKATEAQVYNILARLGQ
jgi:hypothetical protein